MFQSSREQLAIAEYARSLLTIPKQLAVNAAKDSTDLVAKLRAYHNTSQMKLEHKELKWYVVRIGILHLNDLLESKNDRMTEVEISGCILQTPKLGLTQEFVVLLVRMR